MKIGIHFSYWANEWIEDYHRYIDKAADLGFDLLELSCSGIAALYTKEKELEKLKEHAKARGISLTAGYGPGPEQILCSGNKKTAKNGLAFYKMILPILHELDIQILAGPLCSCGPVWQLQGIDRSSAWKYAQENLLCAAELANENQITLAVEVVNRYEGFLLNTCEEAVRFVEELQHPSVQLLLDTFHMNIEENELEQAVIQAGKHLCHLHAAEQNRSLPGQGRLPWKKLAHALKQIHYDGAIVIEAFVRSFGAPGRKACVWRDLISPASEKRMDTEASSALSFLRNVFSETE